MSVGAAEQNTDTAPRIEGCYSVYMYDGKMGMHVPAHFDPPVNTNFLVLVNYCLIIILVIAVLMHVEKQSLHLSVHS